MRDETLLPGTIFAGRFRIESEIGRGGMGVVYAAIDVVTEREVALKVIARKHARVPEFVERFKRECKAVAALSHENIVRLYEANTTQQGDWYLVMERLEGVSLRELLKTAPGGRLSVPHATHIALQLVDALSVAHAKGIWHRDIKPENGFVGEKSRFWLLDFGLAKRASAGTQTDEQRPLGTHRYLPPELVHGKVRPDGRADFYQVGIVYFEMLTGRSPYPVLDDADATVTDIQAAHAFMEPTLLREILPDASARAEAVISRCLRKTREERYQTAKTLGDDLFAVILDVLPPNHPITLRSARHRAGSSDLWPRVTVPGEVVATVVHDRPPVVAPVQVRPPRANPRSLVPTLRGLPSPSRAGAPLDPTAVAVTRVVSVESSGPPVVVREEAPTPPHAVTAPLDPMSTPPDASPPWIAKPRASEGILHEKCSQEAPWERTANGTERIRPSGVELSNSFHVNAETPAAVEDLAPSDPPLDIATAISPNVGAPAFADVTARDDASFSPISERRGEACHVVRVRFVEAAVMGAPRSRRAYEALVPPSIAVANGRWKPRRDRAERLAWFVVRALAGPDAEPAFPGLPPEALLIARAPTPRSRRPETPVARAIAQQTPSAAPTRGIREWRGAASGRTPLLLAVFGGFIMALAGAAFALRVRAPGAASAAVAEIPSARAENRPATSATPLLGASTAPTGAIATASANVSGRPAPSAAPVRSTPTKPKAPQPRGTASAVPHRKAVLPAPRLLF
ncbi:MAG: protein kinase [Polyangiaceae bacterium]